MIRVNETHDHAVYEKIKVLHYFRFAAEELIFFLLISISHILGVAEQLHCSLHVKELKVTTTELEGQAGN